MEEIKFKTITELYKRLFPALTTKKQSINNLFKSNITELDIWNYLKNNIWKDKKNLTLYDMVSDILNSNDDSIYFYIKNLKNCF